MRSRDFEGRLRQFSHDLHLEEALALADEIDDWTDWVSNRARA
jgi:hypothetical protein